MVHGNFTCRSGHLNWTIVGPGPTVLAVSAVWLCLDIFLSPIISLSLWETARYRLKRLSERVVKSKTKKPTNQIKLAASLFAF